MESLITMEVGGKPAVAFKTSENNEHYQNILLEHDNNSVLYITPDTEFNPDGSRVFKQLLNIEVPHTVLVQNSEEKDSASRIPGAMNLPVMSSGDIVLAKPWGAKVGEYKGIAAYSNDPGGEYYNGINNACGYETGLRWWADEYVNRYYKCILGKEIRGGSPSTYYPNAAAKGLNRASNGDTTRPKPGNILCSAGPSPTSPGHVAIIREVGSNFIKVIQQNFKNDMSDNAYRLPMQVTKKGGKTHFKVFGIDNIQGWLWAKGSGPTPGAVSVNPQSGYWIDSPHELDVASQSANKICYTTTSTVDGSTPEDPPEPTVNDDSITGSSGTFEVAAIDGERKTIKIRFRGYNSNGYGPTTEAYVYVIDTTGSLHGTVHEDTEYGDPVLDAVIECAEQTTKTNSNGYFKLSGLPPGSQGLAISKPGYLTYTNEDILIEAGKDYNAGDIPLVQEREIVITNPTPDETWATDKTHHIRWDTVNIPKSYHVTVEYSIDDGQNWIILIQGSPNDASKEWEMEHDPNLCHDTSVARIRITCDECPGELMAVSQRFKIDHKKGHPDC
jgi:hypothetical protein